MIITPHLEVLEFLVLKRVGTLKRFFLTSELLININNFRKGKQEIQNGIMNVSSMRASELLFVTCWREN